MTITRSGFLMSLAGGAVLPAQQPAQPPKPVPYRFERQDLVVEDFSAEGYVLDIGGGGEGIIGRMKPQQVVAIDLFKNELLESPPGPLKIIMDATDLKFLDEHFNTLTAFFSLMYMKPDVQKKVFAEAFRVLKKGGRWLIWDPVIPTTLDKNTQAVVFRFTFKLPKETVQTGYGTYWPEKPMDVAWYKSLATAAGFKVVTARQQPGAFQTFFMELQKV